MTSWPCFFTWQLFQTLSMRKKPTNNGVLVCLHVARTVRFNCMFTSHPSVIITLLCYVVVICRSRRRPSMHMLYNVILWCLTWSFIDTYWPGMLMCEAWAHAYAHRHRHGNTWVHWHIQGQLFQLCFSCLFSSISPLQFFLSSLFSLHCHHLTLFVVGSSVCLDPLFPPPLSMCLTTRLKM